MALDPDSKAKLLPPVDRKKIDNALDCFLDVLREICRSVLPGEKLAAGPVVIVTGGVDAIVKHMKWALQHRECILKKLKKDLE